MNIESGSGRSLAGNATPETEEIQENFTEGKPAVRLTFKIDAYKYKPQAHYHWIFLFDGVTFTHWQGTVV
jgi:hypothetical protein